MSSALPAPPRSLPRGLRIAGTGGSAGIGEAICRLLNAQCATVFNLDLRKGSAGGAEIFIKTDVRSRDSVQQAFEEIERVAGGLDALVNNAGVAFVGGIEDGSDEQWLELLHVNLMGYRDRKSTRLNSSQLMRISYAVFCLKKKNTHKK